MIEAEFIPYDFTEMSRDEMIAASSSFYLDMKRRRSLRHFSSRTVPEDVIRNAVSAAGTAPSGANLQPWHFVIITDKEVKRQIRVGAEREEKQFYQERAPDDWLKALNPLGTDEHKPFLEIAPCLIAIFLKKIVQDESGVEHKTYYPMESVGIATGILITALHLSGLATLTYTPSPMKFLNKILDRPDNERPFLLIVTGYPDKGAKVPKLSKYPFDQITTFI